MIKNSFPIKVWSGLLNEKHRKKMGESIWLFLLFIDWVTDEKDGIGRVWGGKPVTFNDIKKRYNISRGTYHNYLRLLEKEEYITTKRYRYGLSIFINKSKKRKKKTLDVQPTEQDRKKSVDNRASDVQDITPKDTESCTSGVQDTALGDTESCTSLLYKDRHNNYYTKDTKKTEENFSNKFLKNLWNPLSPIFNIDISLFGQYKPILIETIKRHSYWKINSAIQLFKKDKDVLPPKGRIKSIQTFLRFQIDEYISQVGELNSCNVFGCRACGKLYVVRIDQIGDIVKSCRDRLCSGKTTNVTNKFIELLNRDMNYIQVMKILSMTIRE